MAADRPDARAADAAGVHDHHAGVTDTEGMHAAAERRLSRAGQRHTRQRRAIVEQLAATDRPSTVPELLDGVDADERPSQSSLYRNLQVLESVGVVQRVAGWGNHDRFELAEALSGHHHHHLCCTECGTVVDVPADQSFEAAVDASARTISQQLGFTVTGHSVDLYGQCAECG